MREAGCAILGGHSVADDEIKFGYAVTGTIHPARIKANAGARPGDALVFTKRIGTGVISTALKRGIAREDRRRGVDGFHAHSESRGLRRDAALRRPRLHGRHRLRPDRPRARNGAGQRRHAGNRGRRACGSCPGAVEYARAGAVPGGLKNNREFASCAVEIAARTPARNRRPAVRSADLRRPADLAAGERRREIYRRPIASAACCQRAEKAIRLI